MILVTGANSFVGKALTAHLARLGLPVRAAGRRNVATLPGHIKTISIGNLAEPFDWTEALQDVRTVVHLAARAHGTARDGESEASELVSVNVGATASLARQAALAGVKRFIFLSSIGVNGIQTAGRAFTANDKPHPTNAYSKSKLEAEVALRAVARDTGMEVAIIRPPLVYGPGAPGTFGRLVRLVQSGLPLPLGAVHNRRSFIGIDNLADLLAACVQYPEPLNEVLLAADREVISTADLVKQLREVYKTNSLILPMPVKLLQYSLQVMGKGELFASLCGDLQVDTQKTCDVLKWSPPLSLTEGLRRCAGEAKP